MLDLKEVMVMAKTIKELAEEYAYTNCQSDDYHEGAAQGLEFDAIGHTEKTFLAGANTVLEIVENYIQNLDLGNSAEEKFYKLDVIVDIGLFIKQLKGEQL